MRAAAGTTAERAVEEAETGHSAEDSNLVNQGMICWWTNQFELVALTM